MSKFPFHAFINSINCKTDTVGPSIDKNETTASSPNVAETVDSA